MTQTIFIGLLVWLGPHSAFGQDGDPTPRRPELHRAGHDPGPFNDEVYGAVSRDGLSFTMLPGPLFRHASVPDVVELTRNSSAGRAGTLLMYFVDFANRPGPGAEGLSVAWSTDGEEWSEPEPVVLAKKRNRGAAVDPSIVELPDGRLRMYFFGSEVTRGDPASVPGDHTIYSAISRDGIEFEVEPGVRFQAPHITDPEVFTVGEGWWMLLSHGQQTLLARSTDGLKFTQDDAFVLRIGGVPGGMVLPNGLVRVLASGPGGIVSATVTSEQRAVPVSDRGARVPSGREGLTADPACVRRLDGTYYLVFKRRPESDGSPNHQIY